MTRITLLSGCFAAACLLGMSPAYAQGDNLEPGNDGAETTCPVFMAMDESAQNELLGQINGAAAPAGDAADAPDAAANADAAAADAADAADAAEDESTSQAVMEACMDDDKLTVGQALEQLETTP